jgi:formamidopyrimidine-DNA glycosylase
MPELPEVETVVRQLAPLLVGRRIRSFDVYDPLLNFHRADLLAGRRVVALNRLGKQIVAQCGPATRNRNPLWLAVHLRMTGRLLWSDAPVPRVNGRPAPLRAAWRLDRGALLFHDTRRFGTIRLYDRLDLAVPEGLDPTTDAFSVETFRSMLAVSRTPIKPWLLRQDRLVGIGNIYASEALFEAGIHPARPADSLKPSEIVRLRDAIRAVLDRAIAAGGTTFSDFQNVRGDVGNYQHNLQVYDLDGVPCPRCRRPIVRIVQMQRSTYFCPQCQRPPRRNAGSARR